MIAYVILREGRTSDTLVGISSNKRRAKYHAKKFAKNCCDSYHDYTVNEVVMDDLDLTIEKGTGFEYDVKEIYRFRKEV